MLFNTVLAILAVAAPALAGTAPAKYGCMVDSDCTSGQVCGAHNICVDSAPVKVGCSTDADCAAGQYCGPHAICYAASPSSKVPPKPRTTVTKITTWTSTVTTCDNGKCHPCTVCPIYTCIGDSCNKCDECEHKKAPIPTITVVECAACEGGYTTSTCYPDVTTTITACNTCVTPVTPVVPVVVKTTTPVAPVVKTTTPCSTCTTPALPIFYSGAQRTQVAYAGLVGIVAMAAFML